MHMLDSFDDRKKKCLPHSFSKAGLSFKTWKRDTWGQTDKAINKMYGILLWQFVTHYVRSALREQTCHNLSQYVPNYHKNSTVEINSIQNTIKFKDLLNHCLHFISQKGRTFNTTLNLNPKMVMMKKKCFKCPSVLRMWLQLVTKLLPFFFLEMAFGQIYIKL